MNTHTATRYTLVRRCDKTVKFHGRDEWVRCDKPCDHDDRHQHRLNDDTYVEWSDT